MNTGKATLTRRTGESRLLHAFLPNTAVAVALVAWLFSSPALSDPAGPLSWHTTVTINNAPGSGNTSSKALAGDETWTSGTLDTRVYLSSANNAGLMFRTTNGGFGADEAFGYYVGLDTAGNVTLGKQANDWTAIGSASMPINVNTWYDVRVVFEGPEIDVFVDDMGVPKISASDATFTRGQIGVRSHFANARFDDVAFTRSVDVDDFQDGNDNDWSHYGGSFSVGNGVYTLNNPSDSGKSAWVAPSDDMTLEFDVRIASGNGDAGAIFRASSLGTGMDAMNGYYAGLNESGNALVLGRMDGSWTELTSVPLPLSTNTWYRVKVVAVGSDIRVYVTDMNAPKIHVTDATWTSGVVGVRAHFTEASFDDVTVTK